MRTTRFLVPLLMPAVLLGAALFQDPASQDPEDSTALGLHYLEIVTPDRDATCALLEKVHGVTFGEPIEALGGARTVSLEGGGRLGVRAPMHGGDGPVVRPYLVASDIEAAVATAGESGGEIAMPVTPTADGNAFAIYFHGGIEYGLWKR